MIRQPDRDRLPAGGWSVSAAQGPDHADHGHFRDSLETHQVEFFEAWAQKLKTRSNSGPKRRLDQRSDLTNHCRQGDKT